MRAETRRQWLQGGAGLAIGVAAGVLCTGLHTPIPWMLGPLVTIAFLRVAGVRIGAPPGGAATGYAVATCAATAVSSPRSSLLNGSSESLRPSASTAIATPSNTQGTK